MQELIPYKALIKLSIKEQGEGSWFSHRRLSGCFFGMHLVLKALCARVPQWGGGAAVAAEEGAVGFSALGGISQQG